MPLTLDPYLSKELGTRHRAAIGITEESDALVVVVSEENGDISAVVDGEIMQGLDRDRLLTIFQKMLNPDTRVVKVQAGRDEKTEQQEAV